jgi:tetratricopeptide (TPR) repeat protein
MIQQDPSAWYYRGVIYEQLMCKNITSDSASFYLAQALEAYHQALAKSKEESQFHSFASINLQNMWAYYLSRAVQYYKIESFEEALEQLHIAAKIDDKPIENLLYKSIVAQKLEKYNAAIQGYQQCIQLDCTPAPVYQSLAHLTAMHFQQPVQALQVLDTALQQYPWDIGLLSESYEQQVKTNCLEAKELQLQGQLAGSVAMPIAHYQLGYFYARSGNVDQALGCYQKVLDVLPKQIDTLVQLGLLYYNKGAGIIQELLAWPEETFQQEGKEALERAHQALETSLQYFERSSKLDRKNIYLLKALHIIYSYLKKDDKASEVVKKLKWLKGGSQLLEQ